MISYVHLLTAVAIFVHSTWGCCAHESHRDCSVGDTSRSCCSSEHGGHYHSNQLDDHSNQLHTCQLKELQGPNSFRAKSLVSLQTTCTASRQKGMAGHGHQSQEPESHECSHANCSWSVSESQSSAVLKSLHAVGGIQGALVVSHALVTGSETDMPVFLTGIAQQKLSVRSHLANCVLLI